ncbi:hypothetical protein EB796_012812 [Bugula neritina]|uniref:Uncharacterized protein n=1 Tax=Bugula neritina TaxID=10212 RepID=A0A7J7JRB7_BUGNE|nr:hypothetical protein EB796_012812 [Bugula neritina]
MSSNLSERIDDHLGQIVEERASLQGRCEKHNVELEEANLQLQSLQDRVRVLESNESKLAQDNAELRTSTAELQKAKLQADTDLHNTETNHEVARLSAKSERLTTELTEAQVKKVDEESSYSVIRGQLSRKENECLQLIEERNTLDSEKMAFMRQINRLQLEKSSQASNFHHNTETLKNDLSNTQQLLETYKQQSESVTERLRLEQTRHRECRDNFISAEESHRQELASQKKLAACTSSE